MKNTLVIVASLAMVVIVGLNVIAGMWFFTRAMPRAQVVLESGLNVEIETGLRGTWQLSEDSPKDNSKWWHHVVIPGAQLLLIMIFVGAFLLQLLAIFLIARLFEKQ